MTGFTFPPGIAWLDCFHQGKVRDTYTIPGHPELLLTVATDRVSTHNMVHLSMIPGKGHALTALTVFWMREKLPGIRTHLVASGEEIFKYLPQRDADLACRGLVIRKLSMIPVEFIFRSRMAGSLWKDHYQKGLQNPYGVELPPGLQLMSPFGDTIFTPTDKSETDEPLNAAVTTQQYVAAHQLALTAYGMGRAFAAKRGIEIIDGKFEVGIDSQGQVVLADECLTPDSCRFVRADDIVIGQEPAWLDKQLLRAEAERRWAGGKKSPLAFSPAVIAKTTELYRNITNQLTGG